MTLSPVEEKKLQRYIQNKLPVGKIAMLMDMPEQNAQWFVDNFNRERAEHFLQSKLSKNDEAEILLMLEQDLTTQEMAKLLNKKRETVSAHLRNLRNKAAHTPALAGTLSVKARERLFKLGGRMPSENKDEDREQKAWNRAKALRRRDETSDGKAWVEFGILENIEYTGTKGSKANKGLVIYNEDGERLYLERKHYIHNTDISNLSNEHHRIAVEHQAALDAAYQRLVSKIYSNKGDRVAVALDVTKTKPTFFLDLTNLSNLPALTHKFDAGAGSDRFLADYDRWWDRRSAFIEKRDAAALNRLPEYIETRIAQLSPSAGGRAKLRKSIQEKLSRYDITLTNHRTDGKVVADAFEKFEAKTKHDIDNLSGVIAKIEYALDDEKERLKKNEHDAAQLEGRLAKLQDMIAKSKHDLDLNMQELKKYNAEHSAKVSTLVEEKERFAQLEMFLTQANMEYNSSLVDVRDDAEGNPKIKAKGIDPTIVKLPKVDQSDVLDRLIKLMDEYPPATESAAEEKIDDAEAEGMSTENAFLKERVARLEAEKRADRLKEAYRNRRDMDEEHIGSLSRQLDDADLSGKKAFERTKEILEGWGNSLFEGKRRVTVNSPKVRKHLALRAGIPMEKNGAITVSFDSEFLQYGKKKINAYYVTVDEFEAAVILKVIIDSDGQSLIAETFLNENKRWKNKEDAIVGTKKSKADIPLSQYLEWHNEINEQLELDEAKKTA